MLRRWVIVLVGAFVAAGAGLALAYLGMRGDAETEAARLAGLIEWRPGSVVADMGAGTGAMTLPLAARVGASGRVYATEINAAARENLERKVAEKGLRQVRVLAAAERQTNLPPACCDSILMRRVYHHVAEPAALNRSLWESLQPGGKLAIVDFAPNVLLGFMMPVSGVPANRGRHGVSPEIVAAELQAAGFELVHREDTWPGGSYCLIFRKGT